MIIPLGTSRTVRRKPVVAPAIVVLNLIVYVVLAARGGEDPEQAAAFVEQWGFSGFDKPLGLLTHHWIHGGVMSLAVDALFILVMGMVVEDKLGHLATLALYLAGGAAAASVEHWASGPGAPPVVGGGGAPAALIGAFIVFAPGATVRMLLLFPVISVIEIPAGWFIAAAVLKDVLMHGGGGTALLGTVAGYALGIALALGLILTGLATRENFDLLHVFRQQRRLREIRAAAVEADVRGSRLARGPAAAAVAPEVAEACGRARTRVGERLAAGDAAGAAAAFREFVAAAGEAPGRPVLNRRTHLEAAGSVLASGDRAGAAAVLARFVLDHPRDAEVPHARLLLGLLRSRDLGDEKGAREAIDGLESASLGADDQAILEGLRRTLGVPPERKAADDGTNAHQDLRGQGR